jgi:hypothetical protein
MEKIYVDGVTVVSADGRNTTSERFGLSVHS